jgi:ornithine lipid ester-linked acyl 2-hydroxylase
MLRINKESVFYKFIVVISKKVISFFEFLIEFFDGKIVFDNPYRINGVENLEKNAEKILNEYVSICNQREIPGIDEFFIEQKILANNKSWKSFPLYVYGNEFEDNTNLCPATKDALLKIHGFKTAMFSILSAGQKIPPHRGPFKGLLRIHLGLIIPENSQEKCYIELNGVRKSWEFGKTMLFDDTHTHAAYNYTNEDRVVLFIDVLRPLPMPLQFINKIFFSLIANSPFITETMENYKKFGNHKFSKII